ncbi:hypothetical protein [Actinokineospora iranica]|uniref:hypothetical protein n=1 Tax=Actinokineospora iranica TaxID=1271860 RepID=UPI001113B4EC|nr:hypothetical protein [Actinokineospora iranica]
MGVVLSTATMTLVALAPADAAADTCGYTGTRVRQIQGAAHRQGRRRPAVRPLPAAGLTDHDPQVARLNIP